MLVAQQLVAFIDRHSRYIPVWFGRRGRFLILLTFVVLTGKTAVADRLWCGLPSIDLEATVLFYDSSTGTLR